MTGPTEWGTTVGVGPWTGPPPDDARYDPELLAEGDRRNVVDRYRYWRHDAIVADLDERRFPYHVAIENWEHDLNIGTVVRNANAFLASEVHIVGKRRWNRRGAMVTDRYQHIRYHDTIDALIDYALILDLVVIGIDNLPGAQPIETAVLPRACLLLFGRLGAIDHAVRLDSIDQRRCRVGHRHAHVDPSTRSDLTRGPTRAAVLLGGEQRRQLAHGAPLVSSQVVPSVHRAHGVEHDEIAHLPRMRVHPLGSRGERQQLAHDRAAFFDIEAVEVRHEFADIQRATTGLGMRDHRRMPRAGAVVGIDQVGISLPLARDQLVGIALGLRIPRRRGERVVRGHRE